MCCPGPPYPESLSLAEWIQRLTDKYGITQPFADEEPTETQTERTRREANAILARAHRVQTL